MERKRFETTIAGKTLTVEFNSMASQSNRSVLISMGETVVLVNAVMGKSPKEGASYFPLSVDYEEKYYAAGRIPGSRFLRREAKPSEDAVLVSRFIDRTIRPLFDGRMRYDIQISVMVLSIDDDNSADMLAMFGASLALATSNIPWNGPVSTVRTIAKNGEIIFWPTYAEREDADFELIVSGKEGNVNMLEGKSKGAAGAAVLDAIDASRAEIAKIEAFQKTIVAKMGDEKRVPKIYDEQPTLKALLEKDFASRITAIWDAPRDKKEFYDLVDTLTSDWATAAKEACPEATKDCISDVLEHAIDAELHTQALVHNKRADGRAMNEVRPLEAHARILPRTHGSGLFFRGDTHILSIVTLGSPADELLIDSMTQPNTKKRFMHQYNFPPFSVGETGRMGAPGRREIGHGALAEKALEAVIPAKEDFPYAIRVVSETLSSNGSSSMGSVSAACLALMDAGVPLREPVAGIAMGLVMNDAGKFAVLTDLQGPEDHYGDMDLKVAGTRNAVTAIQMDVKVDGVPMEILRAAFKDAEVARHKVMDTILAELPGPRGELSKYAPRVLKMSINPDRIRDLIGPGGKNINAIILETGATIDVEQDGTVFVASSSAESLDAAIARIKGLTKEFAIGEEFMEAKVSRIFPFGAMVEFTPGTEGLVHISELAPFRVGKVEDVVAIGDIVPVKIVAVDELGRINLSVKALTTLKPKEGGGQSNGNGKSSGFQKRDL